MNDFTSFDRLGLAQFTERVREEIGAPGLDAKDVFDALESGKAVAEVRPYGFALIQLTPAPDGKRIPFLWVLYINQASLGRKAGHRFVRELIAAHAAEYHMALYCDGAARRRFFGRLGFVVESKDGEMRRMTTNRDFYR
jgi:hypothetical protein